MTPVENRGGRYKRGRLDVEVRSGLSQMRPLSNMTDGTTGSEREKGRFTLEKEW